MGIVAKAKLDVQFDASGLAAGDRLNVYVDGALMNDSPLPAWPEREFVDGYGFGQGILGAGELGIGMDTTRFVTPEILDGLRTVGVTSLDAAGNEGDPVEANVMVRGTPRPPSDLAAGDYTGGILSLTFTLSRDDDAA